MLKSCSFNAWLIVDIERAVWVGAVVFGGLIIFTSQFKYNITSMPHYPSEIEYSDKYADESYEYRHVVLPREVFKKMQAKGKLLTESQWRSLGIQQSRGWVHYEIHKPEPHILLFRRALGTDPATGLPPSGFVAPPDQYW